MHWFVSRRVVGGRMSASACVISVVVFLDGRVYGSIVVFLVEVSEG